MRPGPGATAQRAAPPTERNTLSRSFPGLNNRAFIVKINRLFRL